MYPYFGDINLVILNYFGKQETIILRHLKTCFIKDNDMEPVIEAG